MIILWVVLLAMLIIRILKGDSNIEIQIPSEEIQKEISFYEKPIFISMRENQKEILLLEKLRSIVMTRLSNN